MKEESINQLKALIQHMEELTLSEKYSKEFEGLIKEAIKLIKSPENTANTSFAAIKQSAIDDLEYEYKKYVRTYSESGSKKEKLLVLKDSRADIIAILYTVLACFE